MKYTYLLIIALSNMFFMSCNDETQQTNTQRFEEMKATHGFASEEFQLEIDNNADIPESEWNKLNEQLIQLKKGRNIRAQEKLYTKHAKPFIKGVAPLGGEITEENITKMVSLSRSLAYNKTAKSVREILEITDANPDFFPVELVENLRSDIENGIIKDIEFTESELEYIQTQHDRKQEYINNNTRN